MANPNDKQKQQDNAPQAPQAGPPAPINPYYEVFDAVTFQPSTSDQVYEQERTGLRSKKVALVQVALRARVERDGKTIEIGGFASIPGSIYLRQPKTGKPYVEFVFFGTVQQKALMPADQASKDHLAAWCNDVARRYVKWSAENGGTGASAKRASTGVEVDFSF